MKILTQNYSNGNLDMLDVPEPAGKRDMPTVRNVASPVSVGIEKAMIGVAKKSMLGKGLARPDWVKHVLGASYWLLAPVEYCFAPVK